MDAIKKSTHDLRCPPALNGGTSTILPRTPNLGYFTMSLFKTYEPSDSHWLSDKLNKAINLNLGGRRDGLN
jgi:hypothetical protein